MKKKLISAENISDYLGVGAKEIQVDHSMIMTAGAKDYLRQKGVKIVYLKKAAAAAAIPEKLRGGGSVDLKKVVTRIVSILKHDLQVKDTGTVESVTQKVLHSLKRR